MSQINEQLLEQIDQLQLGGRLAEWRKAMKAAPFALFPQRQQLFMESWHQTVGDDIEIRRAKAFRHVCENADISILPWELIVGKSTPAVLGAIPEMDIAGDYIPEIWEDGKEAALGYTESAVLTDEDKAIMRAAADEFRECNVASMAKKAVRAVLGDWHDEIVKTAVADPGLDACFFGATTGSIDYPYILHNGIQAYIQRAEGYIESERLKPDASFDKIYFWQASIICMEGMIALAHRYADLAAQQAATCDDAERKAQLLSIEVACRNVPEKPATSLQEALQSMAIMAVGKVYEHPMHNYPHWGRGDQYLYPYFIRDIESGKITMEDAYQMIGECVGRWGTAIATSTESFRDSHQVNYAINSLVLSGYKQDHLDGANELTALFLRTVASLRLSSPTVTVRWNKDTPDWLMQRAIECNLETRGGIPLFQNDQRTIDKYIENGIPWNEAVEWYSIGCVVPTLMTRAEHYGMDGLAAINNAALLWMALHNGRDRDGVQVGVDCGDAVDFQSIEEVKDAWFAQSKYVMDQLVREAHTAIEAQQRYMRLPFLSTVSVPFYFGDGRDLLIPDYEYTNFGISDRAIIDLADSIQAIKELVFDQKKLTMAELMEALDSDFAGARGEEIRQMCLACSKFGNDIDEVDRLVGELSDRSAGYILHMDNSPYRHFLVSREGLSWHFSAGLGVGALPNGRHAFVPLDDGSFSPMGGADKNGPTAVLRSVLKAKQKDAGASVLNQKFSASLLQTPNAREMLAKYTSAFMAQGGSHIQYNIVDTEELKEAQVAPQEHQDLLVRIGGFSAYFVQLSEGIQNDVIQRTEHAL